MCCKLDLIIQLYFDVKEIISTHNTSKLIFGRQKRFRVNKKANVFCSVIFVTFVLVGKIVQNQNHDSGKTVLTRFSNSLVWYVYGHDQQAMSLVYTLENNSMPRF